MTDLTEATQWVDGIYQIETTDPVLGGPPNLQTKAGLSNIQAQQLAHRTAWLKDALGGIGGDAERVDNLDTLDRSGMFFIPGGAVGSPTSTHDGRLLHIERNGEGTQIAIMGTDRIAFRDKDSAQGAWGPWRRVWHDGYAESQVREIIEDDYGIGGDAQIAANLDTLDKSGFYHVPGNAVGSPYAAADGRLIHIQKGGEATQIVTMGETFHAFRDKDSSAAGWGDWQRILTHQSATAQYYSTPNAPDAWLIGENFRGDTSVALDAVAGHCHRIGALAHISLDLRFSGFAIPVVDDGKIGTNIDIAAIATTAGWFTGLASGGLGVAYARLGGLGWDAPWISFFCSASSATGTIYVATGDTLEQNDPGITASKLELKLQITLKVEG